MTYLVASDFELEIARGNVSDMSHVNQSGENADIDTTSDPEDIWTAGGLWVPPTQARTHDIASGSANDAGTLKENGTATGGSATTLIDTAATFVTNGVAAGDILLNDTLMEYGFVASIDSETQITVGRMSEEGINVSTNVYRVVNNSGTGCGVVLIENCLDANWALLSEFIIMNGTSNVATASTYQRIFKIRGLSFGSGGTNAGVISATAQTDATVTAEIAASRVKTLMSIYTIPAGKTGYLTQYTAGLVKTLTSTNAGATIELCSYPFADESKSGWIVEDVQPLSSNGNSFFTLEFHPPEKFNQMTDILLKCAEVSNDDSKVTGSLNIILVDN